MQTETTIHLEKIIALEKTAEDLLEKVGKEKDVLLSEFQNLLQEDLTEKGVKFFLLKENGRSIVRKSFIEILADSLFQSLLSQEQIKITVSFYSAELSTFLESPYKIQVDEILNNFNKKHPYCHLSSTIGSPHASLHATMLPFQKFDTMLKLKTISKIVNS